MRIAIVGNGRMGKALAALAVTRGHTVHTVITSAENAGGRAIVPTRLAGTDVALEFTRPEAAVDNLEKLLELGIPTVTGTTGWYDALPRVAAWTMEHGGALLHSANFSVGVHLFLRAAREVAGLLRGHPEFTASITEEHHSSKRDAPSGTALLLQRQLGTSGSELAVPISSVREGNATGTHTLSYNGPHEKISLSHVAFNRETFAAGALLAAEWLPGKAGVFTFEDILFGPAA
ncbi:MAG TPA: dihydrodipicolinate reductase C-terminal domain-containing protein [Gemmatimonadales bacterium]|nr:dihydrodipicolinate reductase C-terminal domain-containing protein [Gemmatimonadales bacterium]